ncbi:Hypothetical predicted protein [Pelobates cultripes]|uniref:Natterin-3 n=1 Tax=Pelobates cultripes TaxID=61616 RepID=A0AAD1TN44_PELCU|nr:Hypothetical predicted protein [Pelobates cultripes]
MPTKAMQMKVTLVCLVVSSWLLLSNAVALPPNDEKISSDSKDANRDIKENVQNAEDNHHEETKESVPDSTHHNVDLSILPKHREAEIETVEKVAAPWDSRQFIYYGHINLKWVTWSGSLPNGAVSIKNEHMGGRIDYVCSQQSCSTGYYSPSAGSFCYYPRNGKEYRTSSFKILVNEDNFELIQWQSGSYGSYPLDNPIGRCPGVYVGKNQYGLGKFIPSSKVFFLPFSGSEYTYDYYEVLHLYANYHTQYIQNLNYNTNRIVYSSQPIQVLTSSKVINNFCQKMKKVVSLSKTTVNDQKWDIQRPTKDGVTSKLITQVPYLSGNSITFMSSEDIEWREGVSHSKTQTHTKSIEISVDPNHECDLVLQGRIMLANMPFNAELSRFYQNGEKRSTIIQGMFYNEQTDEVAIFNKGCRRIPNSAPCPNP